MKNCNCGIAPTTNTPTFFPKKEEGFFALFFKKKQEPV
jgi:hypothetical protein